MSKAPRPASEGIFANGVGGGVIYQGIVIAALTLASYFYGFHYSGADGMTMAFITLSMCEIFHAFNMRSLHASIFKLPDHNKLLYGSMILAFGLTLVAVYSPLNTFFHLEPLQLTEFLSAMGLSIVIIPIVEIVKLFTRKAKKKAA
jgi:Ca2+-transporting ATPase